MARSLQRKKLTESEMHRIERIQTHFLLIITHNHDVFRHNDHFVNQQARVFKVKNTLSKSFNSVQLCVRVRLRAQNVV